MNCKELLRYYGCSIIINSSCLEPAASRQGTVHAHHSPQQQSNTKTNHPTPAPPPPPP
eukprot:SAG25_NODE_311_length_10005_cov_9.395720_12_plen_57_part_01